MALRAAVRSIKLQRFLPATARITRVVSQSESSILTKPSGCHSQVATFTTSKKLLNDDDGHFMITIQDSEDFKEKVLQSSKPVIVDFHADWCNPCKLLAPRLESIVASQNGKVVLAKVDVDELSDIAVRYNVKAIPTVVSIRNGLKVNSFTGLIEDDLIESFVGELVLD